jgi:hypothetical protein
MPAIQAVLRSLVAHGAKGNGPAQRTFIETVQLIERELAAQAAAKNKVEAETSQISADLRRPATPRINRGPNRIFPSLGSTWDGNPT